MLHALLPLPLLLGLPVSTTAAQQEGEPAGRLEAERWFHWIGEGPRIEALEGRTVLVHFFRVEKPHLNGFLPLCKFHEDYADKGLVILAVSPDGAGAVEALLEDYPLPFPVGAGCDDPRTWGIGGERGQVLIDPRGEVFFRVQAANGIWTGKLRKALRGADRLGERAPLVYHPAEEVPDRLEKAVEHLAEGELERALGRLDEVLENEHADAAEKDEALRLSEEVHAHVERLLEQVEAELARGQVLLARGALEALAEELEDHPFGLRARLRLQELEEDPEHLREFEAAEKYADLVTAFFVRGLEKNRRRFDELMEDHADTHAARKAAAWVELVLSRRF